MEHAVEVSAETLYEAAALALKAFRQSDFAGQVGPGPATRLTVTLRAEESHQVKVEQIENWLNCMGKSPREQALKTRLREAVANSAR